MCLLERVVGDLVIPGAVFRELVTNGSGWGDAWDAQREVRKGSWILVVDLESQGIKRLPCVGIDDGEAEVIALAKATGRVALIDEPKGRREATRQGVRVVGALGILGLAVKTGILARAGPVVVQMKERGLRYGDELVAGFLKGLGEPWPP
jgi:predicted nucleic acid-binding protein